MKHHTSLDRESFQQLLASAYAVQESQIDPRLLSAVVNIQRLIVEGELDAEKLMPMVVDSARGVADATGVAVGLIDRDQLTYRAGSGSSAANIGRQVTASLTGVGDSTARREILRVENSDTDSRIEASICRQFGAKSLLILPIYRRRVLAGVLEIQFDQPHTFPDLEVRTYRLMAGLIDQALEHVTKPEPVPALAAIPPVSNAIPNTGDQIASQAAVVHGYAAMTHRADSLVERCGAGLAALRESASSQAAALTMQATALATNLIQRAKDSRWYKTPPTLSWAGLRDSQVFRRTAALATGAATTARSIAQRTKESAWHKTASWRRTPRKLAWGGLAAVLALTCMIAYAHKSRGTSSSIKNTESASLKNTESAESSAESSVESPAPAQPAQASPQNVAFTSSATSSLRVPHAASPALSKPSPGSVRHSKAALAKSRAAGRRVRVGDNEVDYVRGDVTVRYFRKNPAPQPKRARETARVAHIGRDVTVRYFGLEPLQKSSSR